MDFEKPLLKVALKKLTTHLKDLREFNEVEDISNLKKNLTFWKLKNRQFFYESKIINEKYKTASSQNKESLSELVKLRDKLLEYFPKNNEEKQEMEQSREESYNPVSFGCYNGNEKKFKPKSILLKGSSFVEKPSIKNKIKNMSKKVSFASDFEISQGKKKENKKKLIKMTSCFMECQENDTIEDEIFSKQKSISIRDNDLIMEEEDEQKFEIKMEKNTSNMKNSYLFVNNEKYQSSGSSEDLSDLGRSFPPESLKHENNQLEQFRENMLYNHTDNLNSEK